MSINPNSASPQAHTTQDVPNSQLAPDKKKPDLPTSSPASRYSEGYIVQFALRLVIIICLGSLASISLAPVFLITPPKITTRTSHYTDGACTTNPQSISYQQKPVSNQRPPTPPSSWTKTAKSANDFILAQACAAEFALTYETLDLSHPASLKNVTYMLSSTAKKRFFEGSQKIDFHVDPAWITLATKQHLQQTAQVISKASLQNVQSGAGLLLASFSVPYALTISLSGRATTVQNSQLTVVVAPVSTQLSQNATSWQVVDWNVVAATSTPGTTPTPHK